jgi:hypothetical protein
MHTQLRILATSIGLIHGYIDTCCTLAVHLMYVHMACIINDTNGYQNKMATDAHLRILTMHSTQKSSSSLLLMHKQTHIYTKLLRV